MVCKYANSEGTTIPGIECKKFPQTILICKSVIISSNYNKISKQQASWNDHSWANMGAMSFVVYFDQVLGAACTQKLVETLFCPFSTFFVDLRCFKKAQKKGII